jgi:hypothetical protein
MCVISAAFKDLGRLIFNVGLLLANHCDKYGMHMTDPWFFIMEFCIDGKVVLALAHNTGF